MRVYLKLNLRQMKIYLLIQGLGGGDFDSWYVSVLPFYYFILVFLVKNLCHCCIYVFSESKTEKISSLVWCNIFICICMPFKVKWLQNRRLKPFHSPESLWLDVKVILSVFLKTKVEQRPLLPLPSCLWDLKRETKEFYDCLYNARKRKTVKSPSKSKPALIDGMSTCCQ